MPVHRQHESSNKGDGAEAKRWMGGTGRGGASASWKPPIETRAARSSLFISAIIFGSSQIAV
ncbi:hypothetical protein CK218_17690 [Mesorhizobium sp. WSM3879]|nr:hypothetical protein CK218_17690 [Mesorhizobium sp. WSM3879]